jgi:YesN/AraC family two-component response regulator
LVSFKESPDSFDLIISDMNMPNMTGIHLAKEIKSIRNDIPFIICTGFSDKIDDKKADALGIESILMKPVIRSEIAQTVRKVLDDSRLK